MATYKGNDVVQEDQADQDRKLLGRGLPGAGDVRINAPEAGTIRTRRPGERGYMREQHMADEIKVKKIPMGVSGGPKRLSPNDPRGEDQMEGEDEYYRDYRSPSTVDRPAGPRGYNKGGIVGPNVTKWGSPKLSAPCKDSKTIKCY